MLVTTLVKKRLDQKAMEQLTKAHDLTQELITMEDSPGQQDRLGVILTKTEKFSIHFNRLHLRTVAVPWKHSKGP